MRENEDAARALGKNTFPYKLQSLALLGVARRLAGFFLTLNLNYLIPDAFEPIFTFVGFAILILGGIGSYCGVVVGLGGDWAHRSRHPLPRLPAERRQVAALRFVVVGLLIMPLMAFRPQGLFGKREEMDLDA